MLHRHELDELPTQLIEIDTEVGEYSNGHALTFTKKAQEKVLAVDRGVAELK